MPLVPTLKTVLTKPSDYEELATRPFRAGWWYLYGVLALLCLFFYVAYWLPTLHFTEQQMALRAPRFISEIKAEYPSDLVITVKGGKLSMNKPGPIFFDLGRDKGDANGPQHIVTLDPAGTLETYANYHTLVLVTSSAIIMPRSNDRSLQVFPLDKAQDTIITKSMFDRGMDRIADLSRFIPAFFIVLAVILLFAVPFVGAFFWSLFLMLYLLPASLLTLLIARGYKRAMDYQTAYRFGFYALTYPLIAQTVASTIGYPLPIFSFSLIFVAIAVIVFSRRRPDTTEALPA